VLAAGASQIGQFQAEMTSDAYQVQGMAERGFLPLVLAHKSRHGTPTYGILMSSVGVMFLASFNFVAIVELLNAIYCMAELLEFAAFVWLRVKAPDLPRPYRVPLPTWGLVLMLLPATALLLALLAMPLAAGKWGMVLWTLGAMLAGFGIYPLLGYARDRGLLEFADLRYDFQHPLLAPHASGVQAQGLAGSSRRGSLGSATGGGFQEPGRAAAAGSAQLPPLGSSHELDRRRSTVSLASEAMDAEDDVDAGPDAPLLAPAGAGGRGGAGGARNGLQMTSHHS
jgi:hypothetical protein